MNINACGLQSLVQITIGANLQFWFTVRAELNCSSHHSFVHADLAMPAKKEPTPVKRGSSSLGDTPPAKAAKAAKSAVSQNPPPGAPSPSLNCVFFETLTKQLAELEEHCPIFTGIKGQTKHIEQPPC